MEDEDYIEDFDAIYGGELSIEDFSLDDFDILEEQEHESRYCKPKISSVSKRYITYDNASQLVRSLKIQPCDRADVFVSGNFIFGDFIEAFLVENHAQAQVMTISTLSMSQENVDSLHNLLDKNYVKELNLIVSAYFYSHERNSLIPYIYEKLDIDNKFQLAVAGVHTKTCQFIKLGGKHIVMHGSANLRSSGNIEQFTIEDNKELYTFYDEHFANILDTYKTINKQMRGGKLWEEFTKKKFND